MPYGKELLKQQQQQKQTINKEKRKLTPYNNFFL